MLLAPVDEVMWSQKLVRTSVAFVRVREAGVRAGGPAVLALGVEGFTKNGCCCEGAKKGQVL